MLHSVMTSRDNEIISRDIVTTNIPGSRSSVGHELWSFVILSKLGPTLQILDVYR